MVGFKELLSVFRNYRHSERNSGDVRKNITIYSNFNNSIKMECVLTDDHLTEVYFLNNQFYELEEESLLIIAKDITEGRYSVRTGFFGKQKWIVSDSLSIGPERTTKDDLDIYQMLPVAFDDIERQTG